SEPVAEATIAAVQLFERGFVGSRPAAGPGTSCPSSDTVIPGTALLDAADPTHVRFVPMGTLSEGLTYVGKVDPGTLRAVSGHSMPADYETVFTTVDTLAPQVFPIYPNVNGASYVSGVVIQAVAQAFDGTGVASARWQLLEDVGGVAGAQVG